MEHYRINPLTPPGLPPRPGGAPEGAFLYMPLDEFVLSLKQRFEPGGSFR